MTSLTFMARSMAEGGKCIGASKGAFYPLPPSPEKRTFHLRKRADRSSALYTQRIGQLTSERACIT